MSESDVKVLYIVGFTRSGTTILANVLGELDGFFSAGEMQHHFWRVGVRKNWTCGCGKPFGECEHWTAVLKAGFGVDRREALDGDAMLELQQRVLRTRYTLRYLWQPRRRLASNHDLGRYLELTGRLYHAVADVTRARVVVDHSKWPAPGAALRLVPGVTPYYVHLVRDSRAVAHSWQRKKSGLAQFSPRRIAVNWSEFNLVAGQVRVAARRNSMLLRYEDFAARPRESLEAIIRLIGEAPTRLPLTDESTVELGVNHNLAGNPNRFDAGSVKLRSDDEWRVAMPQDERRMVTAITLPLLRRYGYPLGLGRRTGKAGLAK